MMLGATPGAMGRTTFRGFGRTWTAGNDASAGGGLIWTGLDAPTGIYGSEVSAAGGRCKSPGWAQFPGMAR